MFHHIDTLSLRLDTQGKSTLHSIQMSLIVAIQNRNKGKLKRIKPFQLNGYLLLSLTRVGLLEILEWSVDL